MSAASSTAHASSTQPVADFGSRFSAFVIDSVLLFGAQWLAVIVLARQLQAVGLTSLGECEADPTRQCEGPSTLLWALLLLFLVFSTIAYHAYFEGRHGATPGKRWMGLRVIALSGADPIGYATSALRAIVRQAFWLVLFFIFDASPLSLPVPAALFVLLPLVSIGLLARAAFAADGRGVHDLVAGTLVVRNDQVEVRAARSAAEPTGEASSGDKTSEVAADAADEDDASTNETESVADEHSDDNAEESV